jgi:hypothetical protein
MKALIFNHHPEHTWEIKRSLEANGVDPYIATEKLTFDCGASYCSVNSNLKWRRGPVWFDSKELFEDNFKYSDTINGFDYIFTMNRDIVNNISFDSNKLFFMACVSWDLNGMNDHKKYTKVTAHSKAEQFGAKFLPRFVPLNGNQKSKKYTTQLMEGFDKSIFTSKLLELKNKGEDVIIAGAANAPDGVVMDWDVLSNTSLLVHYKNYGISCTCVLKALECGIPVYVTKKNKSEMGLDDIPDDLFLFAEDYDLETAINKSKDIDNKSIQTTFRKIKNLQITANYMKDLL